MNCRYCNTKLNNIFVDLGSAPPSNFYLTEETMRSAEKWYPLKVLFCDYCWLVQTEDFIGASDMFLDDYAYFSSFSTTWLAHAKKYVDNVITRLELNDKSMVVEIAANDGYLLQYMKNNSIPCYGIEPTHSTAEKAKEKGIEIIEEFFSANLAGNLSNNNQQADLIIANNVLGHVPNINDFIQGIKILLKSSGVATFEFPHLLNLVDKNQFDTIYHEHYSYISLISILSIFKSNDLVVFDVEEIQTHGGSLRVYAQSSEKGGHAVTNNVKLLIEKEILAGIRSKKYYQGFQEKVEKAKEDFLFFLLKLKLGGAKVVAYGAAAKGNTMLNFSGVKPDLLPYVIDKNPSKQGKYMPGSRIPIVSENKLVSYKPDYVVILPWNLKEEIMDQLNYIKDWGGVFVTAIPKLKIYK